MIEQITENPKELKKNLAAEIVKNGWGYGEYIAREALNDIWHNVYLYTERTPEDELIAIGTMEIDDQGFLNVLNLAAKYYRRGSGRRAVTQIKTLAEKLDTTITLKAASEAIEFWQAVGFEIDDCYYADDPMGVVMWQEE